MFVTNFQTKANIFNNHFVEYCSVIVNDSVLPNLVSRCDSLLSNVEITSEKILHMIRSLDPKKAHGWYDLSINMRQASYRFTKRNMQLKPNHSGFCPGDSTIKSAPFNYSQNIFGIDEFPSRETRAVLSKAFGKMWHDGLLFKLKSYGISSCLFTF